MRFTADGALFRAGLHMMAPIYGSRAAYNHEELVPALFLSPWKPASSNACVGKSFKDIVLVIVYNYPSYSSIPLLKHLYGGAFSTIVFCGPKPDVEDTAVEHVYHHKGYFAYMCLTRAMDKYPAEYTGFHGYLIISDDVMFNFWNFMNFDRRRIWEGPKVPIQYVGFRPSGKWYWWKSRWGMAQCQKAYNEIWSLRMALNVWSAMNVTKSLETLAKNGNGRRACYRGRSDVFYIPRRFSEMFQLLAHTFYKHNVFLEIAVPTILRMLDLEDNFEYIPGIYLPGRANDSFVKDSKHFRKIYSKDDYFVHPMKLNYADADMNKAFLETSVLNYIVRITNC
ncbi:hypothetical protein QZH41_001297 [Actinostola sp. cb2023]|nr:hypothetical protein QZH41_001297 [Actinostola sp. cb2023]